MRRLFLFFAIENRKVKEQPNSRLLFSKIIAIYDAVEQWTAPGPRTTVRDSGLQ